METDHAARKNTSIVPSSVLSRQDCEDYLVHVYFGTSERENLLKACVKRAYLDFSRTLRGLRKVESNERLHEKAENDLALALEELKALCARGITESVFDEWHRKTCDTLIGTYKENGYPDFCYGQAQKWINMSLKYIFVLGEERVKGFGKAYPFCHVPLDNILLEKLARYRFPELQCAWSHLPNYEMYLDRPNWIRNTFAFVPLDVEFKLWLGKGQVHLRGGE